MPPSRRPDRTSAARPSAPLLAAVAAGAGSLFAAGPAAAAPQTGPGPDDLVLAVGLDEGTAALHADRERVLTASGVTVVPRDVVEPAVRDQDPGGAAPRAASETRVPAGRAAEQPGGGLDLLVVMLFLLGVLVVLASPVVIPLLIWLRRRRRRRRQADLDQRALEDRAALALVAADDAVAAAVQEHAYAEAQFGPVTVEPFTTALGRARVRLAEAFRLRQLLDDEAGSREARAATSRQIVAVCRELEADLRTQERAAGRLRDVHARAPQDLADARAGVQQLLARAQAAERAWVVIRQQYALTATSEVPTTIAEATGCAGRAAEAVALGTAALGQQQAVAVAQAREARTALARGAAVLDGLDRLARDLDGAPAAAVAAVAEIDADLADATRLAPDDHAVRDAASAARRARDDVRSAGLGRDPLAVLRTLHQAERDLDLALGPFRTAEAARQHAEQRVPRAVTDVARLVTRARAAVDRGGSAVGAAARTRLAEAERLAAEGALLAGADRVAALAALRTAADLAEQAEDQAARNVDTARMRAEGFDPVTGVDKNAERRQRAATD